MAGGAGPWASTCAAIPSPSPTVPAPAPLSPLAALLPLPPLPTAGSWVASSAPSRPDPCRAGAQQLLVSEVNELELGGDAEQRRQWEVGRRGQTGGGHLLSLSSRRGIGHGRWSRSSMAATRNRLLARTEVGTAGPRRRGVWRSSSPPRIALPRTNGTMAFLLRYAGEDKKPLPTYCRTPSVRRSVPRYG
jgi:hypothetical protein